MSDQDIIVDMAHEWFDLQPMELGLKPGSVLSLVAALQLASRHPQFKDHFEVAATAEGFIAAAREYFAGCPASLEVIRRGGDPTQER